LFYIIFVMKILFLLNFVKSVVALDVPSNKQIILFRKQFNLLLDHI